MANNIERRTYPMPDGSDPLAPDVDIELDETPLSNVMEMADGSAIVSEEPFDDEENELPPIDQTPHHANLVAYFEDDELTEIAEDLVDAWKADDASRKKWKETYVKGLDLLGMEIEEKQEPFVGASGVHHPLLAEAVVQFQAQAYKELLPAGGPVLTKVLGHKTPERVEQAERVKDYMNYLIVDQMEEYDSNMDQLLFYLPLAGSAFKKTYTDPITNLPTSLLVMADHLTVPYGTTELKKASRIIHDFVLPGNDLLKYQASGFYSNLHEPEAIQLKTESDIQQKVDNMQGLEAGYYQHDEDYLLIECHVYLDHEVLTGNKDEDDGESKAPALPYIVTLDPESNAVMSIRRNYEENNELKARIDYFTHYKFLPGLGFYGFGLIHMIGGLTSSVTSILRQLIDAGTFKNLPAGLKVKGIRIEGDDNPIAPGEFRDVDSPTGTIKDAIMPLPYGEPSAVLSALLGVLVESGQRFASIADMQVGDTSGQQQPVGTTIAVLERGTKVMSAIHKRLHKAQKQEFKILVRLIKQTLPENQPYPYMTEDKDGIIAKNDFDDRVDVLPISDPNIFSMAQRIMLASQQLQMAEAAPQVHNVREAYRRMYVAMGVSDVETLLKPEEKPQNLTPMQENRKVLQNKMLVAIPEMDHEAHIQAHIVFLKTPYVMSSMEFAANIVQDIMNHISMLAKQQAGEGGNPIPIELALFENILPELAPPTPPNPQMELQARQLDIEEKDDQMSHEIDLKEIVSKEKIAREKNVTTLQAKAATPKPKEQ